jgi:hypothetical protein
MMEKKDLTDLLNEALRPLGYKRKGNYWRLALEEITKTVDLQRSNFGKYYYINYGYIINCLSCEGLMEHLSYRLHDPDREKNKRINLLLDLTADISDPERKNELKTVLAERLVKEMEGIDTEKDILDHMKTDSDLAYMTPLRVREYFQFPVRNLISDLNGFIENVIFDG